MKLDAKALVAPLVAVLVLGLVMQRTLGALRSSGSWRAKPAVVQAPPPDPYARLDQLLAERAGDPDSGSIRDPLRYQVKPAPIVHREAPERRPVRVAPPPRPILTAIIWDNDPRATIRYNGRDYSIRGDGHFADFKVRSITSEQVVLERNGEPLVLTLRPKGE